MTQINPELLKAFQPIFDGVGTDLSAHDNGEEETSLTLNLLLKWTIDSMLLIQQIGFNSSSEEIHRRIDLLHSVITELADHPAFESLIKDHSFRLEEMFEGLRKRF